MKLTCSFLPLFAAFLHLAVGHPSNVNGDAGLLKPRRTTSLLISPPGIPPLPQAQPPAAGVATQASTTTPLNLDNIQGDILVGQKKNKELFFFFSINDATTFKSKLQSDISALITSTNQLLSVSTQPLTAVNIAFSKTGLDTLGITDDLGDVLFNAGQEATANVMGDDLNNWLPVFLNQTIHGLFILFSDTEASIDSELANIQSILGTSITELYRLAGAARPGSEAGHEHFGFLDGIAQPALDGFDTTVLPGQFLIPPGIIIVGADGDLFPDSRPDWAKDGSFLAFRQLQQLVPEFNQFLTDNPLPVPGLTPAQGSELLGARMIGRWKSGAPVDLSPLQDDPVLGADPTRNNNFTYMHPGFDFTSDQTHCPFAAHTRKAFPRADFSDPEAIVQNHMIRSGLPYGPEVTDAEAASGTTSIDRGLAFVAYQDDINNGLFFVQANWFDIPGFIFGKSDPTPGYDPILGQIVTVSSQTGPRFTSGLDPTDPDRDFTLPDFIISRGGEYFFSPPISAITAGLNV
ncbi:hypothetical protein M422DRAFT_780853 [Sphaerobolus stellatus SS14]|uniref:Peroxidase n=1 Tax=Sphaerobolus stellatus (strain SS14) TaxID=990650 RepID=A0A0C9UA55_SPHS4|nr:hypothetical protein M422DRAFT_780853 [Sphaerobolus stellatus SS14]